MKKKYITTVRFSDKAKKLLQELSKKLGISRSAVLELAVRQMAKEENIE
jgi:predicted transcriptional regulator